MKSVQREDSCGGDAQLVGKRKSLPELRLSPNSDFYCGIKSNESHNKAFLLENLYLDSILYDQQGKGVSKGRHRVALPLSVLYWFIDFR